MPSNESRADWRWIRSQLAPHRWMVAGLAMLSCLEIFLRLLLPWPITAIIDSVAAGRQLRPTAAAMIAPIAGALEALARVSPAVRGVVALVIAGLFVHLTEQLVLRGIFPFTFSALTLLTMFGVLMTLDARLALGSMSIVPPLLWCTRGRSRRMAPRARAAREAESAMVSQLYESFSTIRLVKSFVREP